MGERRPSPLRFGAFHQLRYLIRFGARLTGLASTSTTANIMKILGTPLILTAILPLICCKNESADSTGDEEPINSSRLHEGAPILDMVRLLSSKGGFTNTDVVRMFPNTKNVRGGLSDECKINDSMTLHLFA